MTSEVYRVEGRRLGRHRPLVGVPVLSIGDLIPHITAPPPSADHFGKVAAWGMYGNDRYEDCGPAAIGNMRRLITSYLADAEEVPTLRDVLGLYRTVNPGFNPQTDADDNGVILQQMLGKLLHRGIGDPRVLNRKPLAFGRLDAASPNALRWAIALFGCVLMGVDLTQAQETGRTWDYVPGAAPWGGHAILGCGYDAATGQVSAESWAARYELTAAFMEHQLEEAWVIAWPEHLEHPAFLQNVDVDALRSRFRSLTGREMGKDTPVVVTPPVQPASPGAPAVPAHGIPCGEGQAGAALIAASVAWLGRPHSAVVDTETQARQITGLANNFLPWLRAVAGPYQQGNSSVLAALAGISRKEDVLMSQNDEVLADAQAIEAAVSEIAGGVAAIQALIAGLQGQVGQPLDQATVDALTQAVADVKNAADSVASVAPAAPPADGT